MRYITAIFLVITLIGCQSRETVLDDLCKGIGNSYECAQKIEQYQIQQYNNLVARETNKLLLKLDNGEQLALLDNDATVVDSIVFYSLYEFLKDLNIYMIHVQLYEGVSYMLIHKNTGEKIYLLGKIKVSPDKQRLVSYNADIDPGYTLSGFQIIRLVNGQFIEEFACVSDEWGPSDAEWIGNKKLKFEKTSWKGEKYVSEVGKIGNIKYIYKNNKWTEQ